MTYGSSSASVKQAPRTPRAMLREYETVVRPLADLHRELSKFVRNPDAFAGEKGRVTAITKEFGELLKANGVDRIISAWWGESDEADGANSVLEGMRALHQSASTALTHMRTPVRKRASKAAAKKKSATKKR